MSKGRKPKPTALLKAQGTFDAKSSQKQIADGIPSVPVMVQSANETFDWLVKKLDDLGVVAEVDGNGVADVGGRVGRLSSRAKRNQGTRTNIFHNNGARRFDVATAPRSFDDESVVGKG